MEGSLQKLAHFRTREKYAGLQQDEDMVLGKRNAEKCCLNSVMKDCVANTLFTKKIERKIAFRTERQHEQVSTQESLKKQ